MFFKEDEFFITSFYSIKDQPSLLLDTIKLYNNYNSSGMCISNRYFKEIQKEVINYANDVNYPLISIDRKVTYSDIIMTVTHAILMNDENKINESIIGELISFDYSADKIRVLSARINADFMENNICLCVGYNEYDKMKINNMMRMFDKIVNAYCIQYKNYLLIFFGSKEAVTYESVRKDIQYIRTLVNNNFSRCNIGISKPYHSIDKMRNLIEESVIACEVSRLNKSEIELYDKIGIYKVLMRITEKSILTDFYDETMDKLNKNYDSKKLSEMLNMVELMFKYKGNIKEISNATYQHENTIRYRLLQLKTIFGLEDNTLEFYELISLMYKIGKIIEKNKLDNEKIFPVV